MFIKRFKGVSVIRRKLVVLGTTLLLIGNAGAAVAANEFGPHFSPDGRYLIFYSDKDGDDEIYLMELATSVVQQLTDNEVGDSDGVFSPDGTRIAWSSGDSSNSMIFTMNMDGTNQKRVSVDGGRHIRPTWWPDGGRLFYHSSEEGSWRLRSISVDGSGLREHGDEPGDYLVVTFQPGAESIIYVHAKPGEAHDQPIKTYTLHLADMSVAPFTRGRAGDSNHEYSPDEKRIVFNSIRDLNWEIYVMDSDGRNQQRLTMDQTSDLTFAIETIDGQPTWAPDGSMVAFTSGRDGDFDIYLANPDSGWVLNLTGLWD